MNKIAEVHFAYTPKNDDELELTVGDRIEVIGVEEEGWWKGKLKGRIGVFPSNFVVVTESASPLSLQQQHSATSNKLNSIFGSKLGSKSSLSSNNSTSNNSLNNNNNMNTHQLESTATTAEGERKPKPVLGVGYGDIFAAGAKAKVVASERSSNSMLGSTLQKSVPKKPPPPTPVDHSMLNGSIDSSSDKPPLLPPKPSPFSQQQSRLSSQQQSPLVPSSMQRNQPYREQARVIHEYKPNNDDELELNVNDIINIIDKKSEDHGWWKGELNGKIGVFPDNFVQLITTAESGQQQVIPSLTNQSEWSNNRIGISNSTTSGATSSVFSPSQQQPASGNSENRVKSVFSSTPKGFSKELESNLEKHNSNPASFLSLKRNKLNSVNDSSSTINNTQLNMGFMSSTTRDESAPNTTSQNGQSTFDSSLPTKLNHITANRAKGPSRRPPSNVLLRRIQTNTENPYDVSASRKDPSSNFSSKEEDPSFINHPSESNSTSSFRTSNNLNNHNQMSENTQIDEADKQKTGLEPFPVSSAPLTTHKENNTSPSSIRPNLINNAPESPSTPASLMTAASLKTNHKSNQSLSTFENVKGGQKTVTPAASSPPTSTPPWMVNLRKTNAEKKREPPTNSVSSTLTQASVSAATTNNPTQVVPTPNAAESSNKEINNHGHQDQETIQDQPVTDAVSLAQFNDTLAKYDEHYKQSLSELKRDIRQLQDDVGELKVTIENIKEATENQKKYIKELVGNLVKLERNLK